MTAHPYMPNSTPRAHAASSSTPSASPTSRRSSPRSRPRTACRASSTLPPALASEAALRRHLLDLLARNETCERNLSFLGGGIWQHHVPAICDEIVAAQRVPDAGLGHAVLRPRPQPGLVRVREPARRADRDGLRRPARLQLGLRRGPRDPDGGAPHRPQPGARARARSSPERLAVIRTYCGAARAGRPRSRSSSSTTTPRPAASTSTTCGRSSRRAPPPCSSRTPATSARSSRTPRRSRALAREAGAETIVGVDPISLGVARAARRLRRRHRRRLRRSRSACTCPAAAAPAASSPRATRSATRTSTRRST